MILDYTIFNVYEAAQYLKLSKVTVYHHLKAGKIPHARVGAAYRIKKKDLDSMFNDHIVPIPKRAPDIDLPQAYVDFTDSDVWKKLSDPKKAKIIVAVADLPRGSSYTQISAAIAQELEKT